MTDDERRSSVLLGGERGAGEGQVFYWAAGDEMLLDDSLQGFGGGGVVPDAFGIDQGDGALLADAEAVGLGAIDAVEEAEFGQAALEIVPGFKAGFFGAALGIGLVAAKENVAADSGDASSGGDLG